MVENFLVTIRTLKDIAPQELVDAMTKIIWGNALSVKEVYVYSGPKIHHGHFLVEGIGAEQAKSIEQDDDGYIVRVAEMSRLTSIVQERETLMVNHTRYEVGGD